MDFLKKISQSKEWKYILGIILILFLAILIFKAGELVGFRKARFSYQWGEHYYQNFGPNPRPMMGIGPEEFSPTHGVAGQVMKIDGSTIVIKVPDGTEKEVLTSTSTVFREFRDTIQISKLDIDDQIIVIGSPNDKGQIEAKLVRVVPPLPASSGEMPPPLHT